MKTGTIALLIVTIACLIAGMTIGLVLHFRLPPAAPPVPVTRTDTVGDCLPPQDDGDQTEDNCNARGCNWERATSDGSPQCTFPSGYGYSMEGSPTVTTRGWEVILVRNAASGTMWGEKSPDIQRVKVEVEEHMDYRLRVKFTDADNVRYEVPTDALDIVVPDERANNLTKLYDVHFITEPAFGVRVVRKSSGAVVFDTSVPGLVFSNVYHQITTRLASGTMYGLGEHNHRQLKHDMNWKKWTIFTRDMAPVDDWHLYGHQTHFMSLEKDGKATGIMLLNSNAMDLVLQPDPFPAVTYHVIGGVLDFYIFLGDNPVDIVRHYTEATGRPLMPPYWSLGFQLSRWDYDNLTHVKAVVDRTYEAGIPHDVQYGDIDYMERKLLFTYDKVKYDGLPAYVDELHSRGMRYIIILDHALGSNASAFGNLPDGQYYPYEDGKIGYTNDNTGIFIKDPRDTSKDLKAEVWPGEAVYPDFTLGDPVKDWWKKHCLDFYNGSNWGVKYDALWIDMNEPSSFIPGSTTGCSDNEWNYPVYKPNIFGIWNGGMLYDKTICMDAPQNWGIHYNTHSLFGHSMSMTTFHGLRELFPGRRPLVLTRSQFMGSQKYAVHWLGDNQSEWRQIPWSIIGMIEYSLFGFSYTGADICGFWYGATPEMCTRWTLLGAFYPYARNHNAATWPTGSDICGFWFATTTEMCQRWTQVGAFYPFSRNHNGEGWPDQDPVALGPTVARVARDVLLTRYKLLPFLYTLLHDAHIQGDPVVQALVFQFPEDPATHAVDRQFLWGPSFMISPAMEEGVNWVNAYFPKTRWYDYYGGAEVTQTGVWRNISTPLDKINLHVRGGHVIPWQNPALTTVLSRQKPMGLIVALGDAPNYEAHGSLFWDDGETDETFSKGEYISVNFDCINFELELSVVHNGYPAASALYFETIDIWGVDRRLVNVMVNGTDVSDDDVTFDPYTKAASITRQSLAITEAHTITWELEF